MDYTKAKNKDIMRDLCDRMKLLCGQLYAMEKDAPKLAAELDLYYRELADIESTARAYILESMDRVGTQKNFMRALASRKNGKRGGRPPKAITELRKRLAELNDYCTAFEIKHSVKEWHENREYQAKDAERIQAEKELENLLADWNAKRAQDKEM